MMEVLIIIAGVCFGFAAIGLIADHVLPRIKALEKFYQSLPMSDDDWG